MEGVFGGQNQGRVWERRHSKRDQSSGSRVGRVDSQGDKATDHEGGSGMPGFPSWVTGWRETVISQAATKGAVWGGAEGRGDTLSSGQARV